MTAADIITGFNKQHGDHDTKIDTCVLYFLKGRTTSLAGYEERESGERPRMDNS